MQIQFTARHFKPNSDIQQTAETAVRGLLHRYDGIVAADVTVEDAEGAAKMAEISLHVYREKLFARETGSDLTRCVQGCIDKLERQLVKYKEKLRDGRRPHERPPITPSGE